MRLHNKCFHKSSENRDGVTEYETDADTLASSGNTRRKLYRKHSRNKENMYLLGSKKAKINCVDIFKAGMKYLVEQLEKEGVNHCSIDDMARDDVIAFASSEHYGDVTFEDLHIQKCTPLHLNSKKDIEEFFYRYWTFNMSIVAFTNDIKQEIMTLYMMFFNFFPDLPKLLSQVFLYCKKNFTENALFYI